MNLLQEYKELYQHEIAFNDRLNAKISNSLAILTIIGTGEAIIWKDCLCEDFNIIFFILCFLSLQCFIITLYKFYKAYTNYTYGYYPIKETKEFVDKSLAKIEEYPHSKEAVCTYIKECFQNNYMQCAIINREQNLLKSNAHRKLNWWIICSIISIFICYGLDIIVYSNIIKYI